MLFKYMLSASKKFSQKRVVGVGRRYCGITGGWTGLWCCTIEQPQGKAAVAAGWLQVSPKRMKQARKVQSESGSCRDRHISEGPRMAQTAQGPSDGARAAWVWDTSPSLAWSWMQLSINQAQLQTVMGWKWETGDVAARKSGRIKTAHRNQNWGKLPVDRIIRLSLKEKLKINNNEVIKT